MQQIKPTKKTGRVCAICGKRDGTVTYGFHTALRAAGLPNWRDDKAHPRCVKALGTKLAVLREQIAKPL